MKSGAVILPDVLLLFWDCFSYSLLQIFHMNLNIVISRYIKNYIGILMGFYWICWLLLVMVIFLMLIVSIHKWEKNLHLLMFSSISSKTCHLCHTDLSFASLELPPRYYVICVNCEGCYFLAFFLRHLVICV